MRPLSNRQLETQLLAEWLTLTVPPGRSKTHIRVGSEALLAQGLAPESPRARALAVWSDWADARVSWDSELWIIEAAIVGTAGKYGQCLDYTLQYPESTDYKQFVGKLIVPVVLVAFEKPAVALRWLRYGVRTIIHTPKWATKTLQDRIFYGSASIQT